MWLLSSITLGWPITDWSWSIRAFFSHFALGFFLGLSLYVLILTTFRCCGATRTDELRIRPYVFWLALSLSIVVHVLEDYYLGWF